MDWLNLLFIVGAIASIAGLFIYKSKKRNKQNIRGNNNQQAGRDINNG